MNINLYNKKEFIKAIVEKRESGYSEFNEFMELGMAIYGKEFKDAVWRHLNINLEYASIDESIRLIDSAINPYIAYRINERAKNDTKKL